MGLVLAQDVNYLMQAYRLVAEFQARTDPTAFSQILKDKFIYNLTQRLENPSTIHQGRSSLCGPAAVMYCWLSKRPDLYAQYVINVYEKGIGKMGDLVVRPGDDCRNFRPVSTKNLKENIIDVDWVALAALRDSENSVFDYDDENDQIAGITPPGDVEKWFKNIGFKVVQNNTGVLSLGNEYKALLEAHGHFKAKRCVCLLVNADKLFYDSGLNLSASHWIVMNSEPMIDSAYISLAANEKDLLDKQIDFDVFTWGRIRTISYDRPSPITLKEFLKSFYGYIAAEYDESSAFISQVYSISEGRTKSAELGNWRIKGVPDLQY